MSKMIQKGTQDSECAKAPKAPLTIRQYGEHVKAAQQAIFAVTKQITVTISPADLATLKENKYSLCFAKKVGPNYNVVWQSYLDYLHVNTFTWTPQYQLFGSNKFKENVTVVESTNIQPIDLGQTCILDSGGNLNAAADTVPPDNSLTMVNQYAAIHPGVNQLSTGIDGQQVSTPIYVAQNAIVAGSDVLTPKELVLVWFDQEVETSTMFSLDRSLSVEFDLTDVDQLSSTYTNGQWSQPN